MVINSFKTHISRSMRMDSFRTFIPSFNFSSMFDSYVGLFKEFDLFGRAIFNSLFYAFIVIVLVLLVNSFAGYALSRFVFPGSKLIVTIIILILIVPVETSIVPLYLVLFKLGLLNTNGIFGDNIRIIAYVIPSIVSPFYIFMFLPVFSRNPERSGRSGEDRRG